MSKVARVKRPCDSKDENGSTKENPGWTNIGFANKSKTGNGLNLHLNFQPLVYKDKKGNPTVETIYLYDYEKKQEASNDQQPV